MPNILPEQPFLDDFKNVHHMIQNARHALNYQANKLLIELYWSIGQHVSEKMASAGWGKNVVGSLSGYLLTKEPGIKGFSARNIWRMKQFYETYKNDEKLSALLTEFPADTKNIFKDIYLFEFTGILEEHKELDLQALLLKYLKKFLLEMGPDFSFIAEQYVVQVGKHDYRIDLLLHHRGLNCLVAVELKVTDFKPEYLGKLQFYLEALDKDVKKPHENPSIGLLICKTKDDEVVQYAMSRSVSPALIAEYETKLIDKKLLQQKIHELSETLSDDNTDEK